MRRYPVGYFIKKYKDKTKIFIEKVLKLDKDKPYVVYCASGNRSQKASIIMEYLGFKKIYHYKSGYNDWIKD